MAAAATNPTTPTVVGCARRTLDDAGCSLVGRDVLALVSGGGDSVALLGVLAALPAGARPRRVVALHLDHGLRDGTADRAAAQAAATRWGNDLLVRAAAPGRLPLANLHDAARAWRLDTAERVAVELGCDVVATGHHADDQLEQVLGALVDDGAAAGLAAMPVRRPLADGIDLVRPLLACSHTDLLDALADWGLDHVEDAGNHDVRFSRARLRTRVVPELLAARPGGGAALLRVTGAIAEAPVASRALAAALLDAHDVDGARLPTGPFRQLAHPARNAVVAEWLRRGGIGRGVSARTVTAVAALLDAPHGARVDLRSACALRGRYHLVLRQSEAAAPSRLHHGSTR